MRVAVIANAISNALGRTDGSTAALLPSMSPKELGLAGLPRIVKKAAHTAPQGESSTRSAAREEEEATPQRRCGVCSSQMGCLRGFSTAALQWSKWHAQRHNRGGEVAHTALQWPTWHAQRHGRGGREILSAVVTVLTLQSHRMQGERRSPETHRGLVR